MSNYLKLQQTTAITDKIKLYSDCLPTQFTKHYGVGSENELV